jgi:hypothetical protein
MRLLYTYFLLTKWQAFLKYLVIFPFFPQYLMNAQNLIHSEFVTSKPTLMIPNNFLYGHKFERRIFPKLLYEIDSSDVPR